MKKLRNIFLIILVILAAYWVLHKNDVIPSITELFTPKPVVIDETPVILKEIKSIGQLITYTSTDEVVADTTILTRGSAFVNAFNRLSPIPFLPPADKQLVLIGKGRVLAGIDLALLRSNSITVNNDTVSVILPKADIIQTVVNPSDFEVFLEKGQLTNQEETLVKLQVRRKLEARALRQDILKKADAKARSVVRNFLESMGYKKVEVY